MAGSRTHEEPAHTLGALGSPSRGQPECHFRAPPWQCRTPYCAVASVGWGEVPAVGIAGVGAAAAGPCRCLALTQILLGNTVHHEEFDGFQPDLARSAMLVGYEVPATPCPADPGGAVMVRRMNAVMPTATDPTMAKANCQVSEGMVSFTMPSVA